jgi:hypothetical protein
MCRFSLSSSDAPYLLDIVLRNAGCFKTSSYPDHCARRRCASRPPSRCLRYVRINERVVHGGRVQALLQGVGQDSPLRQRNIIPDVRNRQHHPADRTGQEVPHPAALSCRFLRTKKNGADEISSINQRPSTVADLSRPWQSYRHSFATGKDWETHQLPFANFDAHRISVPLAPAKLRRIGLVAIGRAFEADLAIGGIRLYKRS